MRCTGPTCRLLVVVAGLGAPGPGASKELLHFWDLKAARRLDTDSCWKFTWGWVVRRGGMRHLRHGGVGGPAVEVGGGGPGGALHCTPGPGEVHGHITHGHLITGPTRALGVVELVPTYGPCCPGHLELCLLPVELQLSPACLQPPGFAGPWGAGGSRGAAGGSGGGGAGEVCGGGGGGAGAPPPLLWCTATSRLQESGRVLR